MSDGQTGNMSVAGSKSREGLQQIISTFIDY